MPTGQPGFRGPWDRAVGRAASKPGPPGTIRAKTRAKQILGTTFQEVAPGQIQVGDMQDKTKNGHMQT